MRPALLSTALVLVLVGPSAAQDGSTHSTQGAPSPSPSPSLGAPEATADPLEMEAAADPLGLRDARPTGAEAPDLGPLVEAVIAHVQEDLDRIREAVEERDAAPLSGPFSIWGREHYQRDLDRHLDEAFALVAPGLHGEAKSRLAEIDEALSEARAERSERVVERMGAEPAAEGPSLVERARGLGHPEGSLEAVEARLAALADRIAGLEGERDAVIRGFRRELSDRYGVTLDEGQARAALYQVNGATMVESAVAAEVLTAVEARLRAIAEAQLEASVARRYYGVAAVTRLIIVRMHERHLGDYDAVWLPALAELEAENRRLIRQTRALIEGAGDEPGGEARRAALEANLAVQRRIDGVMESYRDVLTERRDLTREALGRAEADAVVAVNTLRTLESAVRLSGVMTHSLDEFRHLMAVSPPALLPLDDERTFEQFLDISRRLEGRG